MQKPNLGDIVMITVDPARNNGTDTAPALITRVWSDQLVNVRALLDGTDASPAYTSVALYADRAELNAAHKRRTEQLVAAGYPATLQLAGAYWPPSP